jgi:predicted enzyme related to lactoylglutathione lyase
MSNAKRATTNLSMITLDCADPQKLADFYSSLTGWSVTSSDPDSAQLEGGPVTFALQRIDGYTAPGWPDDAKHAHLDFSVTDVDASIEAMEKRGAKRPEFQPGGGEWVVMQDPEGHPFCISAAG